MEDLETRTRFEHIHGYQSERSNNDTRGIII